MNLKKLPYWIKGGLITAVIGTPLYALLPEEFSNLAFVPEYAGWFVFMAFIVFAGICILFRLDFISGTNDVTHLKALSVVWYCSIFVTLFFIGALGGIIVGIVKSRRHVRMEPDQTH
jgi:hypothetical protein